MIIKPSTYLTSINVYVGFLVIQIDPYLDNLFVKFANNIILLLQNLAYNAVPIYPIVVNDGIYL